MTYLEPWANHVPRCPECDLKTVHPDLQTKTQFANLWLISGAPFWYYPGPDGRYNGRCRREELPQEFLQHDPLTFCHTCGTPDNPLRRRWQASQRPAIIAQAQEAKR